MKRNFRNHRPLFSSPVPQDVRKPKIRWRILPILWLAIKRTCTVIGAFVLVSMMFALFTLSQFGQAVEEPLPEKMVLYIEFKDGFAENTSNSGFSGSFGLVPPTVHELIDAIDRATGDVRVQGILARMDSGSFAPSQAAEVRDALKRFHAVGKFAAIYSPSYGAAGGGLGRFYLASAFQERWMQPLGIVSIPGVSAEMPFFRGVLDKIGVEPLFFKRKEYKTAYENLTDSSMSSYNRETIEAVVTDLRVELVKDIAADLKITPTQFEVLVNKGLFTSAEALQQKLITHADYVDVLVDRIVGEITGDPESDEEVFVDPQSYVAGVLREGNEKNLMRGEFGEKGQKVALVYVLGAIMDSRLGASAPSGLGDEGIAAADDIAPALLDAADDPEIKAVVVRIDSPGGSPVASETILRSIDRVREKGKPVIVSMGTTAASGGYWVAAHADRIFASPTTITGSIGVVGGKFSAKELWTKLGVNWEGVSWGENSGLWSINEPFTESGNERMNAMLDQVYDAFLQRVSSGRKMTIEQVDKIAGGRVWSGASAKDVGLVDELGGLQDALDYTAKTLGKSDRTALQIIVMPKPLTPFEELLALLGEEGAIYSGLKFQAAVGRMAGPAMKEISVIQRQGNSLTSTYEPLTIR